MKFSTSRLIILWVTILLVVVFIGLHSEPKTYGDKKPTLSIYGFYVGDSATVRLRLLPKMRPIGNFAYLGNYKYQLIVVTLLIGFALWVTAKGKRKE